MTFHAVRYKIQGTSRLQGVLRNMACEIRSFFSFRGSWKRGVLLSLASDGYFSVS